MPTIISRRAALLGTFAATLRELTARASASPRGWTGTRGINVTAPFVAPAARDPEHYYPKAYTHHRNIFYELQTWEQFKAAGHIQKIKDSGFDHIRFPLDPGPIVMARLNGDTAGYDAYKAAILDHAGDYIRGGLPVMFNFHPQREDNAPINWTNTIQDGLKGSVYVAYRETAADFAASLVSRWTPDLICFEPYNEPAPKAAQTVPWNERCLDMHQAIRQAAGPDLLIIWGPDTWYSAARLWQFNPRYFDDNTGWAFHSYEPRCFTYQGYPRHVLNSPLYYIRGLSFPPEATQKRTVLTAALARINVDKSISALERMRFRSELAKAIDDYVDTPMNIDWLDRTTFGTVADWANKNGIPATRVYCNEFGAGREWTKPWSAAAGEPEPTGAAALRDRVNYIGAVVGALEQRGFRWSCFDWCGADFGITTVDGQFSLLPGMKSALRLTG